MSEQDILHEIADAASEFYDAENGPFNSPRKQHAKHRLSRALRLLKENKDARLTDKLYRPWPASVAPQPQADGDAGNG